MIAEVHSAEEMAAQDSALEQNSPMRKADEILSALRILCADAVSDDQSGWRVSAWPSAACPCASFVLPSGLHVALAAIDGTPTILSADQVPEAAALLDRADALCTELELRLGMVFEPQALVDTAPENALFFALSRGPADAETRLFLAFPEYAASALIQDLQQHTQTLPAVRAATPIACAFLLMGPPLELDAAADLAVGDMILLPDQMPCRIIPRAGNIDQGGNAVPNIGETIGDIDGSYALSAGQFQAGSVTQDSQAAGFSIQPAFFIDGIAIPFAQLVAAQSAAPLIAPSALFPDRIDLMLGDQIMAQGKFILGQGAAAFLLTANAADTAIEPEQYGEGPAPETSSEMQAD
jgi:hypothetical protein